MKSATVGILFLTLHLVVCEFSYLMIKFFQRQLQLTGIVYMKCINHQINGEILILNIVALPRHPIVTGFRASPLSGDAYCSESEFAFY